MTKYWPYQPGDTIKSANDNADKEGLASGENDYPNNSIFTFRREAFTSFFRRGTVVFQAGVGRNAYGSAGVVYSANSGDRVLVPAFSSTTFPASQDTYIITDLTSGQHRIVSQQLSSAAPNISDDEVIAAIIVTDALNVVTIIQGGLDNRGRYVYNTAPIGKEQVASDVGAPLGSMVMWPGESNTLPAGYLLADGRALSRSTYSRLFNLISTRFGGGDGSTTFNLPNMNGRMPVGRDGGRFKNLGDAGGEQRVTLGINEMPHHGHGVADDGHSHGQTNDFAYTTNGNQRLQINGGGQAFGYRAGMIARSGAGIGIHGTGGNGSHENMPPYLTVLFIIKVV